MAENHIPSNRQVLIGWGIFAIGLGLGYIGVPTFLAWFCIFAGAVVVFRGYRPTWFLRHIDEQIIANISARDVASWRAWSAATVAVLVLAGSAYEIQSCVNLKPPSYVFVWPEWDKNSDAWMLSLAYQGTEPITSIEGELFDLDRAEAVEGLHRLQGKPQGLAPNSFYLHLFSVAELHQHSLLPRSVSIIPQNPLLTRFQITISTHNALYVEYMKANRKTLSENWLLSLRVADVTNSTYVLDCVDSEGSLPTFMEKLGNETQCSPNPNLKQKPIHIRNEPPWISHARER
jgi:hypothetical protein